MWFQFSLLLFFGAVLADQRFHRHAWNTENQYKYLIQSRTLASLNNDKNVTGIQFKGVLIVQLDTPSTLIATITNPQYARVNTELQDWETIIPDETLLFHEFPLSKSIFQINLNNGMIEELLVEHDMPTWEVNFLKGIVSQLQVDTQGKNLIMDEETQMPYDEPIGTYKVMEDSVGGKCEVVYDIMLPEDLQQSMTELNELMLNPQDLQQFIQIRKLKNYNKCEQQRDYSRGFSEKPNLSNNDNDEVVTKLSSSLILIYGNLKRFTIYSSVTRNHIYVKSTDNQNLGIIHSQVYLSLMGVDKHYNHSLFIDPDKYFKSIRNLVYAVDHDSLLSKNHGFQNSSKENQFQNNNDQNSKKIEDQQYLPKLDEVPYNPMMPFLTNYKNQNIKLSDEFNPIEAAYQKILEITDELKQPDNLLMHETLEKYTILLQLLRGLNVDEYNKLKQRLNTSPHILSDRQNNLLGVFHDAVAQSGTGPALLAITEWVKNENLQTVQMLQVFSQLFNGATNAHALTPDYIQQFFDLISHPTVVHNNRVTRVALVAFSEIVYKARILFPRSNLILNQNIIENYIPYLEEGLDKAIDKNDGSLIQAYIVALGNLGHPKILSVFEPYLEGEKSMTEYERMLIVRSLYRLTMITPEATTDVLYKIYLNDQEAYEVRCMAVYLYLLSDPSLPTLIRMAKYTNYDKSEQVNSAVKSGITSLSQLNRLDLYKQIENARTAAELLTPKNYDISYSQIYFADKVTAMTIGSGDSDIPKFAIVNVNNFYESVIHIEYGLSSIDKFSQFFENQKYREGKSIERLIEMLNIQLGAPEKFKGNILLFARHFGKIFYPFDENDIKAFVSWLLSNDSYFKFNHFYSNDKIISSPLESGLIFSFIEERPLLIKFGLETLKLNGKINAVMSGKVQYRFGFAAPFEHQQYQIGVDTKWQAHLPVEYKQALTRDEENTYNYNLMIRPISQPSNEQIRLLHYSTVPFSTQRADFDLRPVSFFNVTNIIKLPNQGRLSYRIGTIHVEAEMDAKPPEQMQFWNLTSQVRNMFRSHLLSYNKFDVYMDNEKATKLNEIYLNINYQEQNIDDRNNRQLKSNMSINDITDKSPNSKNRRAHMLQEVSRDIQSAKSRVYDIDLKIPLLPRDRQVFTLSLGKSYVDRKSRVLFYWNLQSRQNKEILSEALVSAEIRSTSIEDVYRNFNEAMEQIPMDIFMIDMLIGENKDRTHKIQIEGNFTQSDSLREINLKESQRCQRQMRQGNNELMECLEVIENAQTKDRLKLSMNTNSEYYQMCTDRILEYLSNVMSRKSMTFVSPRNTKNNTVDLEVQIAPNYRNAKMSVNTPKMNVTFATPTSFIKKQSIQGTRQPRCKISKDHITTLDGKYYEELLSLNWEIAMIPVSETRIPKDIDAAIMVRRTKHNTIDMFVMLGGLKYVMRTVNGELKMTVNGDPFVFTLTYKLSTYLNETVFELVDTKQNVIWLFSPMYGLILAYSAYYVDIQLYDRYRNKIRGICGNFDTQENNDFLTFDNCIVKSPQEFVSSYISDSNNYNILDRKWSSKNCSTSNYYLTDVINSEQVERLSRALAQGHYPNKNQFKNLNNKNAQENSRKNIINRTKIEEDDQQICFSVEPVPACPENSVPVEAKLKEIAFHCMPRHKAAHELKHRIQQGANPNMSHKSVSMKHNREVPTVCKITN